MNTNLTNRCKSLKEQVPLENQALASAIGSRIAPVVQKLTNHDARSTTIESKLDSLISTTETNNSILLQQQDDAAKKGERSDKPETSTRRPALRAEQIRERDKEIRNRAVADEQQRKLLEEREKAKNEPCLGFPHPMQRKDDDRDRSGNQQRPGFVCQQCFTDRIAWKIEMLVGSTFCRTLITGET